MTSHSTVKTNLVLKNLKTAQQESHAQESVKCCVLTTLVSTTPSNAVSLVNANLDISPSMEKLKDSLNSSLALMVHAEKIVTIAPKPRPVVTTSPFVLITLAENNVSYLAQSVPEPECSKSLNLSQVTVMLKTPTFAQEVSVQPTSSIVQMLRPVKLDFLNAQINLA